MNHFSNCEKKIGRADITKTEEKLSITLPDDFVSHYLQWFIGYTSLMTVCTQFFRDTPLQPAFRMRNS
ncbi:hypothetical protein PUR50_10315, partial [Enterobacter hormaechei subsp. steigerwaltii]|nr:hypothetical protein [Enterobacter hormaechei subsp. steigerwaltii]